MPDLVPPPRCLPTESSSRPSALTSGSLPCPWRAGEPRESPGFGRAVPIRWGADGRTLYVRGREGVPGRVYRVDPSTGEREIWKELLPEGPAGVGLVDAIQITPDGRSYAYSYSRRLLDLYLIEGLK